MLRAAVALGVAAVAAMAGGAGPGALDPSWGGDGVVTTIVTRGDPHLIAADVTGLVLGRGRIWLSGDSTPPGPLHWATRARGIRPVLLRYLPDGRLDLGFGRGGVVRGERSQVWTLELALRDGGVLVRHGSYTGSDVIHTELVRLRPDGGRDLRFGFRGAARVTAGGCNRLPHGLLRQPDGKLVGLTRVCSGRPSENWYAVARLLPNGRLDRRFGEKGTASVRVGGNAAGLVEPSQVVREPDGKLLVGGTAAYKGEPLIVAVARFTRDGRLDRSFGAGGVVRMPPAGFTASFGGIVVQADGRIVVAACNLTPNEEPGDLLLYGLGTDGALDPSWGSGGVIRLGDRYGVPAESCTRIRPGTRGKFVLLGRRLGRLNADGSVDRSFGRDGVVDAPVRDKFVVAPDGKILILEAVRPTKQRRGFRLVRYRG